MTNMTKLIVKSDDNRGVIVNLELKSSRLTKFNKLFYVC